MNISLLGGISCMCNLLCIRVFCSAAVSLVFNNLMTNCSSESMLFLINWKIQQYFISTTCFASFVSCLFLSNSNELFFLIFIEFRLQSNVCVSCSRNPRGTTPEQTSFSVGWKKYVEKAVSASCLRGSLIFNLFPSRMWWWLAAFTQPQSKWLLIMEVLRSLNSWIKLFVIIFAGKMDAMLSIGWTV